MLRRLLLRTTANGWRPTTTRLISVRRFATAEGATVGSKKKAGDEKAKAGATATAAPAKADATAAAAGAAAPAAAAAAAAAPTATKKIVNSGDDMMSDAQRSKSIAARKVSGLLPDHPTRVSAAPDLYSAVTAISKFPKSDIGKYIKLTDANALPETIAHAIKPELDMTGDYMLVRSDVFSLLGALRVGALRQQSVLIDGGRGVGKSAALALCVAHARQQNELILSTRGEEFLRDRFGQIAPNKTRETILDQPRLGLRYLRALRDAQPEQLKKIKLKNKYTLAAAAPAPDETAESKAAAASSAAVAAAAVTLYDLVCHAASSRVLAGRYWYDILDEARQATEVRVLVVCDGVNWWDHRSELLDPATSMPVRGRRLALADGFLELFKRPPVNGTCLFTTTSVAKDRYVKEYEKMATRRFVLGGYSDTELGTALRHYAMSKIIVSTLDQDYKNRAKALSGNVPADVFEHAMLT